MASQLFDQEIGMADIGQGDVGAQQGKINYNLVYLFHQIDIRYIII